MWNVASTCVVRCCSCCVPHEISRCFGHFGSEHGWLCLFRFFCLIMFSHVLVYRCTFMIPNAISLVHGINVCKYIYDAANLDQRSKVVTNEEMFRSMTIFLCLETSICGFPIVSALFSVCLCLLLWPLALALLLFFFSSFIPDTKSLCTGVLSTHTFHQPPFVSVPSACAFCVVASAIKLAIKHAGWPR